MSISSSFVGRAAALFMAITLLAPGAVAQVAPIGLLGGGNAGTRSGATLAGGATFGAGRLTFTALGEGLFYTGRPDERFTETLMPTAYNGTSAQPALETWCLDPKNGDVFSYGECRTGKAAFAASIDVAVSAKVNGHTGFFGVGYRADTLSEPYALLGMYGAPDSSGGRWVSRLAVGAHAFGIQIGYLGSG